MKQVVECASTKNACTTQQNEVSTIYIRDTCMFYDKVKD